MPAAIPIAAAAVGAIGSGVAGAAGVGKNSYRASNFADTKNYNKDAFQFGGREGGARDYSVNMNTRRVMAENRDANRADYGGANAWERQSFEARNAQGNAANLMYQRATGQTPSIAGQQASADIAQMQAGAAQQMQQGQAAQAAQAASARGAAGLAMAGQQAANNTANLQGQIGSNAAMATQNISRQAQVNAANERMQAEQAAFGAFSGMRQGDQASQGMQAQQAQFQAQQEQANRNANDARAMQYEQLDQSTQLAQMQGQMAQQNMLAGQHTAAQGINFQANQANANREMDFFKGALGSVQGVASGYGGGGGAPAPRAEGGPVTAGKPYLVGERGPELIVPQKDGVVVPNDGLRRVMDSDYRHRTMQAEIDRVLAEKQAEKRGVLADTKRDTPADQAAVKRAVEDAAGREADAMMAGYKRSLAGGAAVARDEGEVDDPRGAPPPWLLAYMAGQQQPPQPTDEELAARAVLASRMRGRP